MAPRSVVLVAALVLLCASPCLAHSENGTFWFVAQNTDAPGARTADDVSIAGAANASRVGDFTAFAQNIYSVNKTLGDIGPRARAFYGHVTGVNTVVMAPTANTTTLWQSLVTLVFREGHYAGSSIVLSGVFYSSDAQRQYSIIGGADDFKYVRGDAVTNSTMLNGLNAAGSDYYLYVNYDVKH